MLAAAAAAAARAWTRSRASPATKEDAMRLLTWSLVLASPVLLGGCYTVRGFGQDLSAAGRSLSNAADTVMGSGSESPPAMTELPPPAAQGSSVMPQNLSPASEAPGQPQQLR
jgi:predicted small secreted protein